MTVLRALTLLLLFVPVHLSAAVVADNVIARVGGVPITAFELQRQVDKVMPLRVSFHGGVSAEKINEIKQEAMNDLIERAYKVKYAIDNEISVPAAKVDDQMKKVRARFKTKKEFKAAVGAETVTGLRAALYRQFLAIKAEEVAVASKTRAGDEEIQKYYAEKKHTFFMPKQFRASHILIKVDPASNAEERKVLQEEANEVLARAQKGEDFFDLAYYNSDDRTKFVGGDLGMFHEGQTEKPFEEALVTMKVGDVSDLVNTRYGFHIIKLTQVNEPRQMTFDEVKLKIKSTLEKERRDNIYAEWIESLRKKYKVERFAE
jgi:parvulin-like peptidyl-prolyl isomerase